MGDGVFCDLHTTSVIKPICLDQITVLYATIIAFLKQFLLEFKCCDIPRNLRSISNSRRKLTLTRKRKTHFLCQLKVSYFELFTIERSTILPCTQINNKPTVIQPVAAKASTVFLVQRGQHKHSLQRHPTGSWSTSHGWTRWSGNGDLTFSWALPRLELKADD